MRAFILLLLMSAPAVAQMTETQAQALYQARDAERSRLWRARQYDKAVERLQEMAADPVLMAFTPIRTNVRYNLARGYSLLGKNVEALATLYQVLDEGPVDPAKIDNDAAFANVRRFAAFPEMVNANRKKWEARQRFWDSPAMHSAYRENLSEDERVAGLV